MWKWRLQHSHRQWLTTSTVILLAILWSMFGPMGLGGQAAYVIINGNSMEPLYHTGDLVILRHADRAEKGEVFAYHYPDLGPVIHRIVDVKDERYIFQGDNNDWFDGYQPTYEELIGKAWLHIPEAGKTVAWLREPLNVTLIAVLIGGFLMIGLMSDSSKAPDRKKRRINLPSFSLGDTDPSTRESGLLILSLLLFVSIILSLLAFTRPTSLIASDDIAYSHSMTYSYSAPADTQVYDQPAIQPGEPVFLELNCTLDVSMAYALASSAPFNVSASYRTLALVSEPNGWKRTLELQPVTPFTDGRFGAQTSLDICEIQRIIERMTDLTGLSRSVYEVTILTEIQLEGEIGGRAYKESISPALHFGLDAVQLYLRRDADEDANPLNWQQNGQVRGTRRVANTLSFFGLKLPVLPVRIISVAGIIVSIAGLVILSLPILSPSKDEVALIHARYGSLIIHAQALPAQKKSQPGIAVQSMDELARLAQQAGVLILETVQGNEHHFAIILETGMYTYSAHTITENVISEE
jgi:signal peptidase I